MISEKMLALGESRSVIREIAAYGAQRKQEIGAENVFDFSIGNPSVPAPEKVNETIISLLRERNSIDLHGYTASAGSMEARRAAAKQESLRAGYEIPPESIYMTCGAAASLTVSLKAVIRPGEKAAVLAPFFPEYRVFIENAGGETVVIPPEGASMQPELPALEEALERGVRAVIINSPNNPSGAILSEETLKKLGRMLRSASEKNGEPVYLIADEPYRELVYDGKSVPFVPDYYENTIVCYSYSKSLSLPGERIGYIMIPPCAQEHEKLFSAICGAGRSMGYVCAPSLMQSILPECALEKPDLEVYAKNRALLYGALTEMGFEAVKPDGAFYLFVKAPGEMDAGTFCERAKKHELLFVPSDSFGMGGYVRIAYCVEEEMIRRALGGFEALAKECL